MGACRAPYRYLLHFSHFEHTVACPGPRAQQNIILWWVSRLLLFRFCFACGCTRRGISITGILSNWLLFSKEFDQIPVRSTHLITGISGCEDTHPSLA